MKAELHRLSLRPRLAAAAELANGRKSIADIGCDHGRLGVSLLLQGAAERCVFTDISPKSLEKARRLAGLTGVQANCRFCEGDGLSPLVEGEAEALLLCGMGGTLMIRMLTQVEMPLVGASLAVFQPMRRAAELRAYLYRNEYWIEDDRVAFDAGRYYEIFSASALQAGRGRQPIPKGFPEGCFEVGFVAWKKREPLERALLAQLLKRREKRLLTARGTPGEQTLLKQADWIRTLLKGWDE